MPASASASQRRFHLFLLLHIKGVNMVLEGVECRLRQEDLRACSVTCKIEFAVIDHVWQVAKHLGLSSGIQSETKILPLGYCMYSSLSRLPGLPPDIRRRLLIEILKLIQILLISLLNIIRSGVRKDPIPYHTSVLSGYHWLLELLTGHPERIRCELGVHKEVFLQLVYELRTMGHSDSKSVMLEEQAAIFLYTCVTGLTT